MIPFLIQQEPALDCPHWIKYKDEWYSYSSSKPTRHQMWEASIIVRKNQDGTFERIKNRGENNLSILNETETKEFSFIILAARDVI